MIIDFAEAKERLRALEIDENIIEFARKMNCAIDEYFYYSGFAAHKNFFPIGESPAQQAMKDLRELERFDMERYKAGITECRNFIPISMTNNPDDFTPGVA